MASGVAARALYRVCLVAATAAIVWGLLELQAHERSVGVGLDRYVRWMEVAWLFPVPFAAVLWLGWLSFAQAAARPPLPGPSGARLIFRHVTRGDNPDVLRAGIRSVLEASGHLPVAHAPPVIEVVTDRPVELDPGAPVAMYVVPDRYRPAHGALFKARALSWLQQRAPRNPEAWYVYLDEESRIDARTLAGILRFVGRAERDGVASGRYPIGQGAILYEGGRFLFRGADTLRTADDLGRFRFQYALGFPLFGVHGSYLVVRGSDDAELTFDVGRSNSLTEDTAWAMRAWARGKRFRWVDGYLHEQPPQSWKDFVRQRARWLAGLRRNIRDRTVPFRCRAVLGLLVVLWQCSFVSLAVAVVNLFARVQPYGWLRPEADFALATFFLAHVQGSFVCAMNGLEAVRAPRARWRHRWSAALVAAATSACFAWYAALEAMGILRSLVPPRGFHVIRKPDLTTPQAPGGSGRTAAAAEGESGIAA